MDWQDKFNDFDTDCSGSIDLEEMRDAQVIWVQALPASHHARTAQV
jgi:Ca2+-binding EF-hand superfamily protein